VHAAVQAHYFDGGWYPKGGAKALPKAFLKELRRHDGEIHVRTGVDRILVEGGGATGATRRATGVRLKDGSEVRAPIVVCNADPNVTYTRLVAPEHVDPAIRRRLKRTKWSISALSLFLAVDKDVRAAGLDSGNWWAKTTDIQAGYDLAHAPNLSDIKEFPTSFLTCTTLKDPSKRAEDAPHTMEAFCFVSHAAFKRWHDSKYDDRPGEYERVKEQLTDKMFDALEHTLPGIRDAAVFTELGTPLTNRHYVEATDGNLYGTEKTWREVGPFAWPVKTKISGLLMCGASTISHGVAGATMSGMVAARIALGCRHRDLYQPAGQELVCVPADSVRPSAKAGEHLAA
jgi:phytoene dehydrogenase-like protein